MTEAEQTEAIEKLVAKMIDDARAQGLPLPLVAAEMTAMVNAIACSVTIETGRQLVAAQLAGAMVPEGPRHLGGEMTGPCSRSACPTEGARGGGRLSPGSQN